MKIPIYFRFFACLLVISCMILGSRSLIYAQEDTVEMEDLSLAAPQDITNTEDIEAPIASCEFSPEAIMSLISGALTKGDILRLLAQDLYRHTNPLRIRSLLDLPCLMPYYLDYNGWQATAQLFYNQITKAKIFDNSPFLKDYILLENSPLANEIDTILQDINDLGLLEQPITINVPQALSLFKNMRVQQYRAGFMFSLAKQWRSFNISARIPFFYQIHALFLNESEINQIKNAPFLQLAQGENTQDLALPDPEADNNAKQFFMQNGINDRVGLGDTRIMALYNFFDNYYNNIWAGLQFTLPTATTLDSGIFFGSFNNCTSDGCFNLRDIINFNNCGRNDKVTDQIEQFSVGALRRLSTILINAPLGNRGHFGMGPHIDMKNYLTNTISLHTTVGFEYLFSKKEIRFFLTDKSKQNFNRDIADESQAQENLDFINQQIINTFFPHASCVNIRPGIIVKLNHALLFDTDHWHISTGFDFWYQQQEKIGSNERECGITENTINLGTLDRAYEGKFFGSIGYYRTHKDFCWHTLFSSDVSAFSSGIGKSITTSLRVGIDF